MGQSAAGGGAVWNGVLADSRVAPGEPDNDALFFGGTNLVESSGAPTEAFFWMGPVAAGNQGTPDAPTQLTALLWDWVLVGYFAEYTGVADFTISGLGTHQKADLYFYNRGDGWAGSCSFGGMPALPAAYSDVGIFTGACVTYFKEVPIVDGQIVGQFSEAGRLLALLSGLTVVMSPVTPPPGPLSVARVEAGLRLTWPGAGTLQSAAEVTGPWSDVAGATSGFTLMPTEARKFFRLVVK